MAVITISITESPIQKVSGIPTYVMVDTNIPSVVYYTLDGSDPNEYSDIAVDRISLPQQNSVLLRLYASNGVDYSPILSFYYGPNWTYNRVPHAKVVGHWSTSQCSFGGPQYSTGVEYTQPAGDVVDAIDVPGIPYGFDGTGTGHYASETDKPYNSENYQIQYTTTNRLGLPGPGIGNLPAQVQIIVPVPLNTSNNANSRLFNPKAMVIYQDGREQPEDESQVLINHAFFSTADFKKIRDGSSFYRRAGQSGGPTGSFVNAIYNPRENTYTFYYRDSETNQWIISKESLNTPTVNPEPMKQIAGYNNINKRRVFRWIPFKRSTT